eukprot:8149328-Alexandrium_andersonii.AAC.1
MSARLPAAGAACLATPGSRPAGTSRAAGKTASDTPSTSGGSSGSTTPTTCGLGRTRTCPCCTAWG